MAHDLPALPTVAKRSRAFVMAIMHNPAHPGPSSLPPARLTFSIYVQDDGMPEVIAATIRLLRPDPAPAKRAPGRILTDSSAKVFDDGCVVVEFDAQGRIDSIEATSYVPGAALVRETMQWAKASSRLPEMMSILATVFTTWAKVETNLRHIAKLFPHPLARQAEEQQEAQAQEAQSWLPEANLGSQLTTMWGAVGTA
ncbi:MAG TPA: hypothetical protein VK348_04085 [Planctomycetota bacterium]|nr:hypothetical protein [Planctomycetota bacterium]